MEESDERVDRLRQNLRQVVKELGLLADAYFAIGVTLSERHLLLELAHTPSLDVGEVAERLLLDKSSASRLVQRAVEKGFVLYRADPKDKRRRFLHLTPQGAHTLQLFETLARSQIKEALLLLKEEERPEVERGASLLSSALQKARRRKEHSIASLKEEASIEAPLKLFETRNHPVKKWSEIEIWLQDRGLELFLIEPSQARRLYPLFQEVVKTGGQFPYQQSSYEEFERHFLSQESKLYLCQTEASQIVGGFYLKPNGLSYGSKIANAGYMVATAYRGQGLGRLLGEASLSLALNQDFTAMQFNGVLTQNTPAVQLWLSLGFRVIGILPEAIYTQGVNQDAYIMHRFL